MVACKQTALSIRLILSLHDEENNTYEQMGNYLQISKNAIQKNLHAS